MCINYGTAFPAVEPPSLTHTLVVIIRCLYMCGVQARTSGRIRGADPLSVLADISDNTASGLLIIGKGAGAEDDFDDAPEGGGTERAVAEKTATPKTHAVSEAVPAAPQSAAAATTSSNAEEISDIDQRLNELQVRSLYILYMYDRGVVSRSLQCYVHTGRFLLVVLYVGAN